MPFVAFKRWWVLAGGIEKRLSTRLDI